MTNLVFILAILYRDQIVRLHGVPQEIESVRDPHFISSFWRFFRRGLVTDTRFSTTIQPQINAQHQRTIPILEDLLQSCMMDFGGSWEKHLPLVVFAYNNSYQESIGMAPFEAF